MRQTKDEYFMTIARAAAKMTTCARLGVGCILVDVNRHVLAVGYNGVPENIPHCSEVPCMGSSKPVGASGGLCLAIHAEQNALLQCSETRRITSVYVTHTPCNACLLMLMNTSALEIVFDDEYPGSSPYYRAVWLAQGRKWRRLGEAA